MYTEEMARVRHHCFTLNNWTAEEKLAIQKWTFSYLVIGEEVGEESGTPHLQGYVEFENPRTLKALKKLNNRISWHERKGTPQQASTYCKKGAQPKTEWDELKENGPNFGKNATIFEQGTLSKQGKRSDLDEIGTMVLKGSKIEEIAEEFPGQFIRYHKGIERLIELQYKHRSGPPYVEWRWGETGLGKTRGAVEKHSSYYMKIIPKWWNGYTQQEAIIIDDFSPLLIEFRSLLQLLDRYPYSGETKGGLIPINSPFIYITCDRHPNKYWGGSELEQLTRRITQIVEVNDSQVRSEA